MVDDLPVIQGQIPISKKLGLYLRTMVETVMGNLDLIGSVASCLRLGPGLRFQVNIYFVTLEAKQMNKVTQVSAESTCRSLGIPIFRISNSLQSSKMKIEMCQLNLAFGSH